MGRKPGSSSGPSTVKQQPSPPYQPPAVKAKQQPDSALASANAGPSASEQRNTPVTNGSSYYGSGAAATTTSYPSLGYGDQPSGGVNAQQNGNAINTQNTCDPADSSQYLYAAASAATGATAPSATAAGEQTTAVQNPLIAFASQATQHVAGQAAENWPSQPQLMAHNPVSANTWQDWTAAIADSQDRYSANALLTLGSGRPGDVGAGGVAGHVSNQGETIGVGSVSTSHAGQWPLLLFDGSGSSSGP